MGSSTGYKSDEKGAYDKGVPCSADEGSSNGADSTKSDATVHRSDHKNVVKSDESSRKSRSKRTTASAHRAFKGGGHSSRSSVIESSASKRKASELEQEKEAPASKKPKSDIAAELRNGWTRGSFTYNKGCRTWISPGRKIEFKLSRDTLTFDALCKSNGQDEVKAWIEVCEKKDIMRSHWYQIECVCSHSQIILQYTGIKMKKQERRLVFDCKRHDEEMNVDLSLIRVANDPKNAIGPGWEVVYDTIRKGYKNKKRTLLVSPTRKMQFR